jgi:hypothetical protein
MPRSAALHRTVAAASLLAAILPSPTAAAADEVRGTRSEALVERSHEIRLVLDHGVATLRTRRTVYNGGERHDQALFWIGVPDGAVATGLRTKGTLHGRPHWFAGELLEAELAAERYRELTGIGGYYPKDPALLSWRDPSLLALQVFPVAPQADKTVEYTLTIATRYEDGRDHLELPAMGTEAHHARITVHPAHPRDQVFVDGEPVASGYPFVLAAEHALALARHRAPRIEARLASVPFATDRVLMHYDVALAPHVSKIPSDAEVVVLLDGSFSMTAEQRKAAQATARAYLEHFAAPRLRARAEVLVFDREVKARHGRLVPVREALADLDHLELPGANGSAVDDALDRAHALFTAAKGPRRILLLTDARTREALQPTRLQTLAERSGATVHVGIVEDGPVFLGRDDQHPWADVATATGGLVWQLAADPEQPRAELRATFEELARPVRLDHVEVRIPPLAHAHTFVPERLDEGQGIEALALVGHPIDHLRIEGQLWSRPVHETVFADPDEGRRWAALVFGSGLVHELSDEEMMVLALHGGAVSPVTSYLAIEPGVRPSTEGLDETEGMGLIGRGGGGGSGMGTSGHGSVGLLAPDMRQELLERRVREALDACGGRGLGVRVELESTLEEIVAVDHPALRGSNDSVTQTCLENGVWAIGLSNMFIDDWRRWVVDLPAA